MKKITKLGKIAYEDRYTFKVTDTKVATRFCEHCGNFRAKTYYFTGRDKKSVGTTWCKDCIETFDISPEQKQKFKKGEEAFYITSTGEWIKTIVLYCKYEYYTCEVIATNGYSNYKIEMKESELSKRNEFTGKILNDI